jgi:hypothetical protein
MAQTIKIKRSTSNATPTTLLAGELAYSGKATSNKLFIGHPDGTTGVVAIGGQYYTSIIDSAASANTASKLVVRDGSGNFSAGTITANITGNVSGSAGTVTSISGHDTDDLSEGSTNLYFTNARADARITAADTGDLSEGSNLYHTTARARGAISASGDLSYNSTTGVISFSQAASAVTSVNSATGAVTLDTGDISESGNLYYTDARTDTRVDTILKHSNHGNITVADGSNGELVLTAAAQYGDSDVQSYLSGGTGVTLSSGGEFSIGQAVATNSNVTFNNVSVDGTLTSDDITSTNISVAGNATITGNLIVQGTTTTVNSTAVAIGDNIMVLNKDEAGTPSANAGIEIERGTATNVSFLWNETNDNWTVSNGTATSVVLTAANFAATFTGTLDGGTF